MTNPNSTDKPEAQPALAASACSAALVQTWNERAKHMRAHAEDDQAWQPERAGRYIARAEIYELCARELQAIVTPNDIAHARRPE